jgi:hypothetical protein
MYIKNFTFAILFISLNLFSFGIERYVDMDLIKKSAAPRYLEKGVLITLSLKQGKQIFLRTNIDGWKNDYFFNESLFGIKYCVIPYDKKNKKILYKLNIDGFWDKDPNNADYVEDKYGTDISVVNTPREFLYDEKSPMIENTESKIKQVVFFYKNPNAKEVNFVCSIDNWNQFTHQMKLNSDGVWEFSMTFKKGFYSYYFLSDEKKVIDHDNDIKVMDDSVGEVSGFVIE